MKEWTEWFKCKELLDVDEYSFVKLDLFRLVEGNPMFIEFLAKFSNIINLMEAREVFEYFSPNNKDEKIEITTRIETIEKVLSLIDDLIPTDQKERFNDARRTYAGKSERRSRTF